jgi:hypothetical protein
MVLVSDLWMVGRISLWEINLTLCQVEYNSFIGDKYDD